MQLRFASFAVINSREDLHLQECARAGRTRTRGTSGAPAVPSKQDALCKAADLGACHHQVIEHPHVHERQRRLQRLSQELIGPARLH